ncbi:hypothetical protein CEXT_592941 [Caerostris extrusa]|uniref:50S ribosomal protein L35 n=1 Tax=Caerostris extrusa TaxID=172846 RepID=A0AAV4RFQ8_CAEEX|nr:hypothetical protein CEXT_592941 [Caerostris extrusa]
MPNLKLRHRLIVQNSRGKNKKRIIRLGHKKTTNKQGPRRHSTSVRRNGKKIMHRLWNPFKLASPAMVRIMKSFRVAYESSYPGTTLCPLCLRLSRDVPTRPHSVGPMKNR